MNPPTEPAATRRPISMTLRPILCMNLRKQPSIPVQILGKLRGKVVVPAGSDQASLIAAARGDERIAGLLAGKEVVKTIVVPGKLVNFVVK